MAQYSAGSEDCFIVGISSVLVMLTHFLDTAFGAWLPVTGILHPLSHFVLSPLSISNLSCGKEYKIK
jgi:hypothetical protein